MLVFLLLQELFCHFCVTSSPCFNFAGLHWYSFIQYICLREDNSCSVAFTCPCLKAQFWPLEPKLNGLCSLKLDNFCYLLKDSIDKQIQRHWYSSVKCWAHFARNSVPSNILTFRTIKLVKSLLNSMPEEYICNICRKCFNYLQISRKTGFFFI